MKNRIIIKQSNITHIIKFDEILYCEADGNYSIIHLSNSKRLSCSKTLKAIGNDINSNLLIRIHQSFLVNVEFIRHINRKLKTIVLSNKTEIPFTVRYSVLEEKLLDA